MPNLDRIQLIMEEIGPACDLVNAVTQLETDAWAISCVDDEIHVLVELNESETLLAFHVEHGAPKDENRLTTYETMLIYNGIASDAGARLALEAPGGQVTQECDVPVSELDLHAFQQALENFVAKAVAWRAMILSGGVPATANGEDTGQIAAEMAGPDPNAIRV